MDAVEGTDRIMKDCREARGASGFISRNYNGGGGGCTERVKDGISGDQGVERQIEYDGVGGLKVGGKADSGKKGQ